MELFSTDFASAEFTEEKKNNAKYIESEISDQEK